MGKRSGNKVSDDELVERAKEARSMAHAPYSNFEVGAALLAADGRVFTGCNIENSTYGLTMCAERVAIFKAVSEGAQEISKMAVVADFDNPTPPCGCCRQMIWEFSSDDTEVILANLSGDVQKFAIKELFPEAFDARFLEGVS
ncbi:MAG TPA: cytidine deaminase [Blastocatellia bacterium]|nr:cytidine deaminase [Blastocatellia bacterium]